ncbi:MAG: thioredoxin family protein, partial [Chloroflexi bacterium]
MRLHLLLFGIVAGLWFIISSGLPAATPAAWAAETGQPVVRAVLFWSDECPHCHVVLAEVLPPLQERYGEQFQLKMLQVEIPQNWELYQQTVQLFNIQNDRFGVPTLIIGRTVLV